MSIDWTHRPGVSGDLDFRKITTQGIAIMLCAFVLVSCGPVSSFLSGDEYDGTKSPGAASAAQESDSVVAPLTGGGAGGAGQESAQNGRPLQPGQSGFGYGADGLPALKPARGVNLETLFSENIEDPMARIKRVENAVLDLRRDFEAVLPAIVRLSAVEADIQDLVVQLRSLLRNESPQASAGRPLFADTNMVRTERSTTAPPAEADQAAPITPSEPAPDAEDADSRPVMLSRPASQSQDDFVTTAEEAPPQRGSPPPSRTEPVTAQTADIPGTPVIKSLRLGEHDDKTRIVLDASGAVKARYDLDNMEGLLIIELPGAGWSAAMSQTLERAPLIASYNVHEMAEGGSRLVIQLRHDAQILQDMTLSGPPRYVIDVRSNAVHR